MSYPASDTTRVAQARKLLADNQPASWPARIDKMIVAL
jgi:hypothetical protein